MLHIEEKPIEPAKATRVTQWLVKPECGELLEHLSSLDARLSAEAANILTDATNGNRIEEAKARADEAQFVREMLNKLVSMRNPDYKFHRWTVSAVPTSTIQPQ